MEVFVDLCLISIVYFYLYIVSIAGLILAGSCLAPPQKYAEAWEHCRDNDGCHVSKHKLHLTLVFRFRISVDGVVSWLHFKAGDEAVSKLNKMYDLKNVS